MLKTLYANTATYCQPRSYTRVSQPRASDGEWRIAIAATGWTLVGLSGSSSVEWKGCSGSLRSAEAR